MVLVDKSGTLKNISVKTADLPNLYKKAGFTSIENFQEHHTWETMVDDTKYSVSLWGKKIGKNAKNQYVFPNPFKDTKEFCGNVILMNHKGEQSLTILEWNKVMDKVCQEAIGLDQEDGNEEEDEEDEEEEYYAGEEDDPEDEEETHPEEDEEELYVASKKKKHTSAEIDFMLPAVEVEEVFLDCSAELQPEEYWT